MMLSWAKRSDMPVHILLTKADKLKKGPAKNTLLKVEREIVAMESHVSVQMFSALKNQGLEQLQQVLSRWLQCPVTNEAGYPA